MAGFDPNQPRDDIGRWTETGAGGNGISGRDRQLLGLAPAPSPAARASAPGPAARASAPGPAARASAPASGNSQMTNRDRQLLGLAPGPSRPGGSAAPAPQPLGLAPSATPQTAQNTRQTPANLLKISSPAQASPGTLATQSNSVGAGSAQEKAHRYQEPIPPSEFEKQRAKQRRLYQAAQVKKPPGSFLKTYQPELWSGKPPQDMGSRNLGYDPEKATQDLKDKIAHQATKTVAKQILQHGLKLGAKAAGVLTNLLDSSEISVDLDANGQPRDLKTQLEEEIRHPSTQTT